MCAPQGVAWAEKAECFAHSCIPEFDTNEQESLQSKSSRCVFVRIEWVALSPIWLRISGSAMAMYLLICASGFSQVGRSNSYSIFAMGTCEFIVRAIPIGAPVFPGRSYPGHMEVTSSPIEQQRHP